MLVGSPIEAELAMDMYLAGLLTCVSMVQTAFPENRYSSGLLLAPQRSQLRGSGGISPRFPLPDGVVIALSVEVCQF